MINLSSSLVFLILVMAMSNGLPASKGKFLAERFERALQKIIGCSSPDGKIYPFGKRIVVDNCRLLCVCLTDAFFECKPLCLRYFDQHCPVGLVSQKYTVRTGPPEFGCKCTKYKCV